MVKNVDVLPRKEQDENYGLYFSVNAHGNGWESVIFDQCVEKLPDEIIQFNQGKNRILS